MPSESPTSRTSIPARSIRRAMVASYAVSTAIFSPRFFFSFRSGTRIRLAVSDIPLVTFVQDLLQPAGLRFGKTTAPRDVKRLQSGRTVQIPDGLGRLRERAKRTLVRDAGRPHQDSSGVHQRNSVVTGHDGGRMI